MIRVTTAARLHFGLFVPESEPTPWLTAHREPLPVRRFGGVGLMIEEPGIVLTAEPAASWSATGPLAERALAFAHRIRQSLSASEVCLNLTIERAMSPHSGLGSGTQLGLAVARVLAAAWGVPHTPADLARWSGRGLRSGLGLHGFAQGGFLIEAGKPNADGPSLLLARHDFPTEWAVVLIQPPDHVRMHGPAEQEAFDRLRDRTDVAALSRLVLLALLPALLERDLNTFGRALHEFNRRAGEVFAPIQGGPYASPALAELIDDIRNRGVAAVGQSSWGPTVFAIAEPDRAESLASSLAERGLRTLVTRAANQGARVEP